ncbi:hypothetical protein AX17_006866, partial [Amanita inopinata Kibby_2008]
KHQVHPHSRSARKLKPACALCLAPDAHMTQQASSSTLTVRSSASIGSEWGDASGPATLSSMSAQGAALPPTEPRAALLQNLSQCRNEAMTPYITNNWKRELESTGLIHKHYP